MDNLLDSMARLGNTGDGYTLSEDLDQEIFEVQKRIPAFKGQDNTVFRAQHFSYAVFIIFFPNPPMTDVLVDGRRRVV